MKQTINFEQFCDSFKGGGGADRSEQFSYEGKRALFDYLENYEEETGEELELDPIALCCEYTEYKNLAELQEDYTDIKSVEELEENTQVIPIGDNYSTGEGSFIIAQY